METVGELSSASRDLALHRFRLLEPHLEHDCSFQNYLAKCFRVIWRKIFRMQELSGMSEAARELRCRVLG